MAMHCDSDPHHPAIGLPHIPWVEASEMALQLRKDIPQLLGEVAANGSTAGAVGKLIQDRLWTLHNMVKTLEGYRPR